MNKTVFEMSDEDIMNMTAPPSVTTEGGDVVDPPVVEEEKTPEDTSTDTDATKSEAEESADDKSNPDESNANEQGDDGTETDNKEQSNPGDETPEGEEKKPEAKTEGGDEAQNKEASEEGDKKAPEPNADAAKPTDVKEPKTKTEGESETPPNYEEMYNKIMAPFKANGKTIELKNPEEAVGLMQMGANYTKKMQELQPFRKILMMLQNNNLVDENKLSFLIDIDKKNPDAIHKLIKESGVDPLTLDTESETTYLEGNHKVSNDEYKFASTVESVGATDLGKETLNVMKTWDDTSKELLWSHPEVMTIIHQQREAGVFQVIDAEVDRQRALGQINPETPYLEAYKIAGDHLQKTGGLPAGEPVKEGPTTPKVEKVVLDERPVAPKPKVKNGDQANAAAPARSSQQKIETKKNPLAMSDDEFMKQFDGRL